MKFRILAAVFLTALALIYFFMFSEPAVPEEAQPQPYNYTP